MLRTTAVGLAILFAASLGGAQSGEGWESYVAKDYGFSMLVPEGTRFVEREFAGGWGELWAEHEGVKFYALAKLGEQATPEEIEKVGVQLTGIPNSAWKTINEGENQAGWIWFRTVEASQGGKLILGDYGTGKRGSYLLILETTESDYREYKADYEKWYASIRLN
jgi:hypothetical protein